jgi:hypothetical protein
MYNSKWVMLNELLQQTKNICVHNGLEWKYMWRKMLLGNFC